MKAGLGQTIGGAKNSARQAAPFTFRLDRAGFEPRRADGFATACIYCRRVRIYPNFESCEAYGAAQNRRGQTIERIKARGAPSFSPYRPWATPPIRRFAASPYRAFASRINCWYQ